MGFGNTTNRRNIQNCYPVHRAHVKRGLSRHQVLALWVQLCPGTPRPRRRCSFASWIPEALWQAQLFPPGPRGSSVGVASPLGPPWP